MIEVAAAACVVALAGTYTMEPTILGLMQPGDVHEPLPLQVAPLVLLTPSAKQQ
jgi:hypothetical protein